MKYKEILNFSIIPFYVIAILSYIYVLHKKSTYFGKSRKIHLNFESECECRKSHKLEVYTPGSKVYAMFHSNESFFYKEMKDFPTKFTCNVFDTVRRGPNQKVISISVPETDSIYFNKLNILKG